MGKWRESDFQPTTPLFLVFEASQYPVRVTAPNHQGGENKFKVKREVTRRLNRDKQGELITHLTPPGALLMCVCVCVCVCVYVCWHEDNEIIH